MNCYECSAGPGIGQCDGCNGNMHLTGAAPNFCCDASCQTCTGPLITDCLSCPPGPPITIWDPILHNCCNVECKTCFGPNRDQCTSCPNHYYLSSANICGICDATCDACVIPGGPTDCTSCILPLHMLTPVGACCH